LIDPENTKINYKLEKSMSTLVERYEYKGIDFDIMEETDPDDGTVYYYWERPDLTGPLSLSFLPEDTIELVKEDARREVEGKNVVSEEAIQEATEMLKNMMHPN
jgi:hypothetical protein